MKTLTNAALLILLWGGMEGAYAQSDFWQQINGPLGGNIAVVAVNANGHIFAGSYNGGVFKSLDHGEHWRTTEQELNAITVYALLIDYHGRVWVGTGRGVYCSNDNGEHWQRINAGLDNKIVFTFVVTYQDDIFAGTYGFGVFKLSYGDTTWTHFNDGLTKGIVRELALHPNGKLFAAIEEGGVYKTVVTENRWVACNNGLSNFYARALLSLPSGELIVGTTEGAFFSNNEGGVWEKVASQFFCSFVYDPDDEAILAASEQRIYRSKDRGRPGR